MQVWYLDKDGYAESLGIICCPRRMAHKNVEVCGDRKRQGAASPTFRTAVRILFQLDYHWTRYLWSNLGDEP